MDQVKFKVPGISCGHCVNSIQTGVSSLPGIKGVWADQQSKLVEVEFEPPANVESIKEFLASIDYPVED